MKQGKRGTSNFGINKGGDCCPINVIKSEILFGGGGVVPPVELALVLTWDNISNTPVVGPTNVAQWNTLFDLPTNGTPFTSVSVVGNVVNLYGGSGIFLSSAVFGNNDNIVSINDTLGCLVDIGVSAHLDCSLLIEATINYSLNIGRFAFQDCSVLQNIFAQLAADIGQGCFDSAISLTTIELNSCTNLGGDTGDNGVFNNISGQNITLTVPAALMTCDGGNPDGDIVTLQANNTVTIITV